MGSQVLTIFSKALRELLEEIWFLMHPYSKTYIIEGTKNMNKNLAYCDAKLEPDFQALIDIFKSEVEYVVKEKKSFSFYKFGDGDFYFLNGIPRGSAKPGKRAISKKLSDEDIEIFRKNSKLCSRYMCEIPIENRLLFSKLFPGTEINYPAEIVYGLVANNWFTSRFSSEIGIIGADVKVELIQKLLSFPEYQEYLSIDKFNEYLTIPQKFACDNFREVYSDLKTKILESNSRFFLAGIGHLKSAVLAPLAKETGSVIIDIGSGVDALAGVINNNRPYFANWTNFQIPKEFDYSRVDFLQFRNSRVKNLDIRKIRG